MQCGYLFGTFLFPFIVHGAVIGEWFDKLQPAKCLHHPSDHHIYGISWKDCQKACHERGHCLAVSYRRSLQQCILNYLISEAVLTSCPGFMYAQKQEPSSQCSCPDLQVCSVNGPITGCIVKECRNIKPPLNGKIHGNIASVDSKMKISCNNGFTLVTKKGFVCSSDGRWVDNNGNTAHMAICVVEGLAFVSANQTSTFRRLADASFAIDGDVNSRFNGGSCSHTSIPLTEPIPAWTGQLGRAYTVTGVVIYNRMDCCSNRLRGINVFIGENLCGHLDSDASEIVVIYCEGGPIQADAVTVEQTRDVPVTLCEVKIF